MSRSLIAEEVRATLRLALPLIATQLCTTGANVVDVMLAGHLGAHVLGAVAIGTSVWFLALMMMIGVMLAVPPTVAQLDGAGRRREVGGVLRQALWLALGFGVALQQALSWGGPFLVSAVGVDVGVADDASRFLRAVSFGAPAIGIFLACRGTSDGLSLPRAGLMITLLGLVVLLPTGFVLMYGRLGVPALGASGSGIATALVSWIEAGCFVLLMAVSPRYRGLGWNNGRMWPDFASIAGLLRLGVPMAVSVMLEVGLFSFAALAIGRLGASVVASHQIALNVAALTFMVPLGVAMAITVRVGNAVGRGDEAGVRRAGMTGIGLALLTQAVSSAVMLGAPAMIVALYTNDAAVRRGAATLLQLAGLFQFSDGVQVASAGALRGLKDTRLPMLITAAAYWGVGVPIGWLLAFRAGMGAPGMWIGLIAGLSVAAALLFARFNALSRRRRVVEAAATCLT
jgi:multidrug resistance protein, MATE family